MKKSPFFAGAMLCLSLFFCSFQSQPIPPVHADGITVKINTVQNERAIKLRAYNLQKKPTRIILQDKYDTKLISEKVMNHNGYRKLINLEGLNNGEYSLIILNPIESKNATITIKNKNVDVNWN